jgi:hypothetical protein
MTQVVPEHVALAQFVGSGQRCSFVARWCRCSVRDGQIHQANCSHFHGPAYPT